LVAGWQLADAQGRDRLRWARATFPVLPPAVFPITDALVEDIATALDGGAPGCSSTDADDASSCPPRRLPDCANCSTL